MGITRRALLSVPLAAVALNACSSDGKTKTEPGQGGPDELFAESASFEIIAKQPQRVMVGMTTKDNRILHGGQVTFDFRRATDSDDAVIMSAPATFLSVPRGHEPPSTAVIGTASDGIGVYAANNVTFPDDGFWIVTVNVAIDKKQSVETGLEVLAAPKVPAPGDKAPRTQNSTINTADFPIEALDSRSGPNGLDDELADPILHQESIANVLAAKRPCLVLVSTPTFCESKFCGPITDVISDLATEAKTTKPELGFVHLEVWRNYEKRQVNKAAAEWILPNEAPGNEPWVFLIDGSGTITKRWDNLVSEAELRASLATLK
jgi:hypothetical protein